MLIGPVLIGALQLQEFASLVGQITPMETHPSDNASSPISLGQHQFKTFARETSVLLLLSKMPTGSKPIHCKPPLVFANLVTLVALPGGVELMALLALSLTLALPFNADLTFMDTLHGTQP
jgi:hypothetical protein